MTDTPLTHPATKTAVGYCDPFSVEPGEPVDLLFSAEQPGPCRLELVRLICGDLSTKGPGFLEEVVARPDGPADRPWPASFASRHQPIKAGSFIEIESSSWLDQLQSFTLQLLVYPTRPGVGAQGLARIAGFNLILDDERPTVTLRVGDDERSASVTTTVELTARRWSMLTASFDAATGRLQLRQAPLVSRFPSDRLTDRGSEVETVADALIGFVVGGGPLRFAAGFDGRLEDLLLIDATHPGGATESLLEDSEATFARWDLSHGIGTTRIHDVGPLGLHGVTRQGPARAVTGSRWDGSTQRWSDAPEQYAAMHFHRDDLTDAGWDGRRAPAPCPTGSPRGSTPSGSPPRPATSTAPPSWCARLRRGTKATVGPAGADGHLLGLRQPPHDHRRVRVLPVPGPAAPRVRVDQGPPRGRLLRCTSTTTTTAA